VCIALVALAACRKAPPAPKADAPVAAAPAIDAEARAHAHQIVEQSCQICHAIDLVQSQRLAKATWEKEVKKMIGWGAPVAPEEVAAVAAMLADEYGVSVPPSPPPSLSTTEVAASFALDEPSAGGDAKHGAAFYQLACASCHGGGGVGGPIGPALVERPILHRAHDFAHVVRTGLRRMPAVPVDDATMRDLFAFLRAPHG
jgi:mono/diheme cytochrome c family protein